MEEIRTLYYERFIQHVVEVYAPKLKQVRPGHCMKITGLALKELRVLLPLLRPINENLSASSRKRKKGMNISMQRNSLN